MFVFFKVTLKAFDTLREECDLNFGATCITVRSFELINDLFLSVRM